MKYLYKITVIFLFFIIAVVSVLAAFYHDESLWISKSQIFVRNLGNDREKLSKTATQNNIMIYTKNIMSHDSNISVVSNIYSNLALKSSPFYLDGANSGVYDTFIKSRSTNLYDISLLKYQDVSDFWIIGSDNDSQKFISDLKSNGIDYEYIDVNSSHLEYDFKSEYYIAILIILLTLLIIMFIKYQNDSKDISLRIIYSKKITIYQRYIVRSIITYLSALILILIILTVSLYMFNQLSRFDIAFNFYIYVSLLCLLVLVLTEPIILWYCFNKINLKDSIKGLIPNQAIFKGLNIVIIFSLLFSAAFMERILSNVQLINADHIQTQDISKIDNRVNQYHVAITNRYFSLFDNNVATEYNVKINEVAMLLQENFEAQVLFSSDDAEAIAYVNSNFFIHNKLFDSNNKLIVPENKKKIISLKDEFTFYDYYSQKVVTTKTLHQNTFSETYLTGSIDLTFDYLKNKKAIDTMIYESGNADVIAGIFSVLYDIQDRQLIMITSMLMQAIFNFIFFFTIFIFSTYLFIKTYLEIEKKKIGLKRVYNKSIYNRYKSLFVIVTITYIITSLIGQFNSFYEVSFELIFLCYLLSIGVIIFYSKYIELNKINRWLNGG
ncbi:hypothetical protein [Mycoplasma sp. P36-A1]|uniref:hypothetical protein n=1 Tax=Mycoplasma sp. P36-A1 TaxID=3252900 RepID=UPI003C2C38C2